VDVALVVLVAVALAALPLVRLFARQDRMVFRPGRVLDRRPATIGIAYEELRLPAGEGMHVTAWWVAGAEDAPVVVYLHGSAGNLTHELPVVQFLHSLGVNSLLVEYVGYDGDGRRPSEEGCYRTASAALEHVTVERGFADDRVILFGHSLGAAVAARSAAGRRCAGLVLQSGFTSVGDLAARAYPYLPVRPFVRTRLNALAAVGRCPCSVLVIHSLEDEHIPYEHGLRLFEQAPAPKKLVTLRGSHFGHSWQGLPEVQAAWHELVAQDFATWTTPSAGS
jgi:pimeloyl-ACP methyl ester carboxylesterase